MLQVTPLWPRFLKTVKKFLSFANEVRPGVVVIGVNFVCLQEVNALIWNIVVEFDHHVWLLQGSRPPWMTTRLERSATPGPTLSSNGEIMSYFYFHDTLIATWLCFSKVYIVKVNRQNFSFLAIYLYPCIWSRHKMTRWTVTNSFNESLECRKEIS